MQIMFFDFSLRSGFCRFAPEPQLYTQRPTLPAISHAPDVPMFIINFGKFSVFSFRWLITKTEEEGKWKSFLLCVWE